MRSRVSVVFGVLQPTFCCYDRNMRCRCAHVCAFIHAAVMIEAGRGSLQTHIRSQLRGVTYVRLTGLCVVVSDSVLLRTFRSRVGQRRGNDTGGPQSLGSNKFVVLDSMRSPSLPSLILAKFPTRPTGWRRVTRKTGNRVNEAHYCEEPPHVCSLFTR